MHAGNGNEGDPASWLVTRVFNSLWARISQYGYPSDGASSIFALAGIRAEATKLLEELVELRKGEKSKRPLIFVAHDIGGIIVKEVRPVSPHRSYNSVSTITRHSNPVFCRKALRLARHDPSRFPGISSSTTTLVCLREERGCDRVD